MSTVLAPAAVRERPILFSGPMVRAILDGRKTQTRRVVKRQPPSSVTDIIASGGDFISAYPNRKAGKPFEYSAFCPYGAPGDRLWVREAFYSAGQHESDGMRVLYREGADYPDSLIVKWRPSIFMPRWASRITLEITGVRVERVQAISEEDAIAEGCFDEREHDGSLPSDIYRQLWDSLNAKRGYSWNSNPWVWVLEFKRTEAT